MKEIQLTQNKVAIVDDDMFEYLNQFKWCARKCNRTWYVSRDIGGRKTKKKVHMHRLILGVTDPNIFVDHKDFNGLNNQRYNLRIATKSQNGANSDYKIKNATSIYRGVHWHKQRSKWNARIKKNGITEHLGVFDSEIDAAICYNKKALELHGEFAYINKLTA